MKTYLSKSLLNNFRQCPRRLWLELQDRRARREGRTSLATMQYSAAYLRVAAPKAVRNANGYSDPERQQTIDRMLKYCAQDTKGMALIVRELMKKP